MSFKWFILVNLTHAILGSNGSNDLNGSNGSFWLTGLTNAIFRSNGSNGSFWLSELMLFLVQMVQMVHFAIQRKEKF